MTEILAHWAKSVSTDSLNSILQNADAADQDGKPYSTAAVDAVRVEKDRRLADPNSPDFRPTFF